MRAAAFAAGPVLVLLGAPRASSAARVAGTGDVLLVGNVRDLEERRAETLRYPVGLGFFLGIRGLIGEGHDQVVDDVYTSRGGRLAIASGPRLADVVGIDLRTRRIAWRTRVDCPRPWSTNNGDGTLCLVAVGGEDRIAVISYASAEIASIRVGDHPQRARMGAHRSDLLPRDRVAPSLPRLKVVRRGRGRALSLRASEAVRPTIDVRRVRAGARGRVRVVRRPGVRRGR